MIFGVRLPILLMVFSLFWGCGTTSTLEEGSLKPSAMEESVTQSGPSAAAVSATMAAAEQNRLSVSHVFVSFENASKAKPQKKGKKKGRNRPSGRTKEEALSRITEAYQKLQQGVSFESVAQIYSDCFSKGRGGDLGIIDASRMSQEFTEAAFALKIGEVSNPVETPLGYHIIRRQVVEEVRARHVLIMYEGTKQKPTTIHRSKTEALGLIQTVSEALATNPDSFQAVAKKYSDCPSGHRGGDLGTFGRGTMSPPFENVVFSLKENELSGVVETEFGFHIIQRLPLYMENE